MSTPQAGTCSRHLGDSYGTDIIPASLSQRRERHRLIGPNCGFEIVRRRSPRPRDVTRRADAIPATSLLALALGAAAFGAVAVGVLAIGRLAVSRMAIKKARFEVLEVDELTVRRLRVLDYEGPPPRP